MNMPFTLQNEYTRNIVNTIKTPLVILNNNLKVELANRSFYKKFKSTPENTIGEFFYKLSDNQWDIPKLRRLLENILPQNSVFNNFEIRQNFEHLGHRTMLLDARELRQPEDKKRLILLVIEDITERKKTENELNRLNNELSKSNQRLQEFAYIVSHDLQEPLRAIASFSKLLERKYKNEIDNDGKEFIQYIVDGAERMQHLIQDLLKYSRIQTNKVHYETIDLGSVVDSVEENLQMIIDETEAKIIYQQLPKINADKSQIILLLQNLIHNAIKYRGDNKPKIEICAEEKENEWLFSVKDNGIGIDKKYSKKIFQIFQSLNTRDKEEGTGIGLALCKRIIEKHRGRIWLKSEVGEGSIFNFTIKKLGDKYE